MANEPVEFNISLPVSDSGSFSPNYNDPHSQVTSNLVGAVNQAKFKMRELYPQMESWMILTNNGDNTFHLIEATDSELANMDLSGLTPSTDPSTPNLTFLQLPQRTMSWVPAIQPDAKFGLQPGMIVPVGFVNSNPQRPFIKTQVTSTRPTDNCQDWASHWPVSGAAGVGPGCAGIQGTGNWMRRVAGPYNGTQCVDNGGVYAPTWTLKWELEITSSDVVENGYPGPAQIVMGTAPNQGIIKGTTNFGVPKIWHCLGNSLTRIDFENGIIEMQAATNVNIAVVPGNDTGSLQGGRLYFNDDTNDILVVGATSIGTFGLANIPLYTTNIDRFRPCVNMDSKGGIPQNLTYGLVTVSGFGYTANYIADHYVNGSDARPLGNIDISNGTKASYGLWTYGGTQNTGQSKIFHAFQIPYSRTGVASDPTTEDQYTSTKSHSWNINKDIEDSESNDGGSGMQDIAYLKEINVHVAYRWISYTVPYKGVSNGQWIIGFDGDTGEELWRFDLTYPSFRDEPWNNMSGKDSNPANTNLVFTFNLSTWSGDQYGNIYCATTRVGNAGNVNTLKVISGPDTGFEIEGSFWVNALFSLDCRTGTLRWYNSELHSSSPNYPLVNLWQWAGFMMICKGKLIISKQKPLGSPDATWVCIQTGESFDYTNSGGFFGYDTHSYECATGGQMALATDWALGGVLGDGGWSGPHRCGSNDGTFNGWIWPLINCPMVVTTVDHVIYGGIAPATDFIVQAVDGDLDMVSEINGGSWTGTYPGYTNPPDWWSSNKQLTTDTRIGPQEGGWAFSIPYKGSFISCAEFKDPSDANITHFKLQRWD